MTHPIDPESPPLRSIARRSLLGTRSLPRSLGTAVAARSQWGEWFESRDGERRRGVGGGRTGGGLHRQSYGMQHAKEAATPRTRTLVWEHEWYAGGVERLGFYGEPGRAEGVWSTARLPMAHTLPSSLHPRTMRQRVWIHFHISSISSLTETKKKNTAVIIWILSGFFFKKNGDLQGQDMLGEILNY